MTEIEFFKRYPDAEAIKEKRTINDIDFEILRYCSKYSGQAFVDVRTILNGSEHGLKDICYYAGVYADKPYDYDYVDKNLESKISCLASLILKENSFGKKRHWWQFKIYALPLWVGVWLPILWDGNWILSSILTLIIAFFVIIKKIDLW